MKDNFSGSGKIFAIAGFSEHNLFRIRVAPVQSVIAHYDLCTDLTKN